LPSLGRLRPATCAVDVLAGQASRLLGNEKTCTASHVHIIEGPSMWEHARAPYPRKRNNVSPARVHQQNSNAAVCDHCRATQQHCYFADGPSRDKAYETKCVLQTNISIYIYIYIYTQNLTNYAKTCVPEDFWPNDSATWLVPCQGVPGPILSILT